MYNEQETKFEKKKKSDVKDIKNQRNKKKTKNNWPAGYTHTRTATCAHMHEGMHAHACMRSSTIDSSCIFFKCLHSETVSRQLKVYVTARGGNDHWKFPRPYAPHCCGTERFRCESWPLNFRMALLPSWDGMIQMPKTSQRGHPCRSRLVSGLTECQWLHCDVMHHCSCRGAVHRCFQHLLAKKKKKKMWYHIYWNRRTSCLYVKRI